jgi:hypothetical protein
VRQGNSVTTPITSRHLDFPALELGVLAVKKLFYHVFPDEFSPM